MYQSKAMNNRLGAPFTKGEHVKIIFRILEATMATWKQESTDRRHPKDLQNKMTLTIAPR